ncbi:MAG: TolC family protein [Ignavibacteriales bacterium]|nr:TolC family protein [Ignavibacteriales bacterium]
MIKHSMYILIMLLLFEEVDAQSILDQYVQEGISHNLVLQQKKISYEKAIASLKIATSYFFPSINFQANYTSGKGGRSISIPVGDLMNPVYKTLNQLTGSNSFPQIQNVEQTFFPYKFYDVKIRTAVPLLNTDLIFNREVQNGQTELKSIEVKMYKRELVKEIKVAFFNILSASAAAKIYDNVLQHALEGKRVNESLLKNGTGLPVYILRSESEIENIKSQKVEAENQLRNAKYYFNFLLNKDLESPVNATLSGEEIEKLSALPPLVDRTLSNREEVKMLRKGIEINESVAKMNNLYWVPKVSAFLDLGVQDQKWNYNAKSRYYIFGLQLDMPIFEAFRNKNKIDEAELNLQSAELDLQNVTNQLHLSVNVAANAVTTANQNYITAAKQLEAAVSYHKLIMKGYQEGINSFIETVDARTQLLSSELSANINKYKVLISIANYERELATNKLN